MQVHAERLCILKVIFNNLCSLCSCLLLCTAGVLVAILIYTIMTKTFVLKRPALEQLPTVVYRSTSEIPVSVSAQLYVVYVCAL